MGSIQVGTANRREDERVRMGVNLTLQLVVQHAISPNTLLHRVVRALAPPQGTSRRADAESRLWSSQVARTSSPAFRRHHAPAARQFVPSAESLGRQALNYLPTPAAFRMFAGNTVVKVSHVAKKVREEI